MKKPVFRALVALSFVSALLTASRVHAGISPGTGFSIMNVGVTVVHNGTTQFGPVTTWTISINNAPADAVFEFATYPADPAAPLDDTVIADTSGHVLDDDGGQLSYSRAVGDRRSIVVRSFSGVDLTNVRVTVRRLR